MRVWQDSAEKIYVAGEDGEDLGLLRPWPTSDATERKRRRATRWSAIAIELFAMKLSDNDTPVAVGQENTN